MLISTLRGVNFTTKMSYRTTAGRRGSTLQMVRDICTSISIRSHDLFSRPDHRTHQNPYAISNIGVAMTTTKAKLISIFLFVLSIFMGAIVLGTYYMKWWHPNTDKIFKWNEQAGHNWLLYLMLSAHSQLRWFIFCWNCVLLRKNRFISTDFSPSGQSWRKMMSY